MKCSLLILFSFVFLTAFHLYAAEVDMTAKPEAGKQVAQNIQLPKSTGAWNTNGGDVSVLLHTSKQLDETASEDFRYWIFLPKDYDADSADKTWPLMIFLHGAGERGTDLAKVKVHGPPKKLEEAEFRDNCRFIVVSPQCLEGNYWSAKQILLLLDSLEKSYKVDKKKIYVTGLSMGGFGTWMLAAEAPQRFAAMVPICGGGDSGAASKMVDLPIWAFHGEQDRVVRPELSRKMIEAIEKAGGKKAKLTVYPDAEHDSWTETYNNPELYKWMLQQ